MSLRRRELLALPLLGACGESPRPLAGGWLGPDPASAHRLRHAPPSGQGARPRRSQVLVLGAGVAGLVAARALARAGVEVDLLEWDEAAGGNSRAARVGGQPCPLGAHYLPQPGPALPELRELLVELGAADWIAGRWQAREEYLCHAPAERVYARGQWWPGLLPPAPDAAAQAQRQRFAAAVRDAQAELGFALPSHRAPWGPGHRALDAQTFGAWLDSRGLVEPELRAYLDYCCRDDYGAGAAQVSAWAGLHYFASRHGFAAAPEDGAAPVLTWPQGNAWLVERLAAPLQGRLHLRRLALAVDEDKQGWSVLAQGPEGLEQWRARDLVLAVPLFVARRLLRRPEAALQSLRLPRAPWLVANLQLAGPLLARRGAPPAWDSVIQGSAALGYVDARHQGLDPRPGPTVLTAYWALPEARRPELLSRSWQDWLAELLVHYRGVHPDLPERLQAAWLTRWGHAMAIPAPGVRGQAALVALREGRSRLRFAHSDLAGYSVFEEAFAAGQAAATGLLSAARLSPAPAR